MSRDLQITVDCADPAGLARFWAEVLGYRLQPPPAGFDSWEAALQSFGVPQDQWNSRSALVPDAGGPRLFFQRVPEQKSGKNRLHLDVRAAPGLVGADRMAALEAEADRLTGLGAIVAYRVEPDPTAMDAGFITMHDPEGNEFCLD